MAFADDKAVADNVRQQSHAAATTDAQHKAADIAYHTAILQAARKWGQHTNSLQALINLGAAPPAGSYTPNDT